MYYDQHEFDIRFEWGMEGLRALLPATDIFVIVDVLSFSTCVDIAVANGAVILPYRYRDASAESYAAEQAALLAGSRRSADAYSLAPSSLQRLPRGTRLVLPSPNGATLSLATAGCATFAGCLRNAQAVARAAQRHGGRVSVIGAGERWPDGSLRPGIEDLIGAGAIIQALAGTRSPEATIAAQGFAAVTHDLEGYLLRCSSGKELCERGFAADVQLAAAMESSAAAPQLRDGAFVDAAQL